MGSWNETCAISKMTINADEPIRLIVIAQSWHNFKKLTGMENPPLMYQGSNGCYVTDLWQPIYIPIKGVYNDYGIIDTNEIDPSQLPIINGLMKVINKRSIKVGIGENSCHDVPVTNNMSFEEAIEAIREGRLYLKPYNDAIAAVGMCLVKESVWQSLLESDYTDKELDKWSDDEEYNHFSRNNIREGYKLKVLTNDIHYKMTEEDRIKRSRLEMFTDSNSASWNLNMYRHLHDIDESMIEDFVNMEIVFQMLRVLRIGLHPTIGAGSQTSNETLWKRCTESGRRFLRSRNIITTNLNEH